MSKTCILIPALNCEHSIAELLSKIILQSNEYEIIVLDDCSDDKTGEIASTFNNVFVYRNPKTMGYGEVSRKLYQIAYERKADFAVNVHGDMGHPPESIVELLNQVKYEGYDLAIGSRLLYIKNLFKSNSIYYLLKKKNRYNMPIPRIIGHILTTSFQNMFLKLKVNSYHEGMRACNSSFIRWALTKNLTDWYEYDSELLIYAFNDGFNIKECPIKPHYDDLAKSSTPMIKYGLKIIKSTCKLSRYINVKKNI
jgi:glycosyltransferase involved in cell wall biosynthesis